MGFDIICPSILTLQNPLHVLSFRWMFTKGRSISLMLLNHIILFISSPLQNLDILLFTAMWRRSYVAVFMYAVNNAILCTFPQNFWSTIRGYTLDHKHKHTDTHTNTLGVPEYQLCCSCSPLWAYLASRETSSPVPPSSLNTDPQTQWEASTGPNTQSLLTCSLMHTVHFPSHTLTLLLSTHCTFFLPPFESY